jgi:hypothetical protein
MRHCLFFVFFFGWISEIVVHQFTVFKLIQLG